jgi:hypothetical protein
MGEGRKYEEGCATSYDSYITKWTGMATNTLFSSQKALLQRLGLVANEWRTRKYVKIRQHHTTIQGCTNFILVYERCISRQAG